MRCCPAGLVERVAAGATSLGHWVVDGEPGLLERVDEVDGGFLQVGLAHPVDDQTDTELFGGDVARGDLFIGVLRVAKPGAPAWLHGDPEGDVEPPLLLQQFSYLPRCGFRQRDHSCSSLRRDVNQKYTGAIGISILRCCSYCLPDPRLSRRKSATSPSLVRSRSSGEMGKTASGAPAAAQTTGWRIRSRSIRTRCRRVWPNGGVLPIGYPVASLTSSAVAFRARRAPRRVASRPGSAWFDPEVNARKGVPSPTNTRDLTIWPISHPMAAAASTAVLLPRPNPRDSPRKAPAPDPFSQPPPPPAPHPP